MNKWNDSFKDGKEVVLSTCSDNKPNANIVISLGFYDDKLLIADCQMKTTIDNLKQNGNVCVVGGYFRAKGVANVYNSGMYFDICSRLLSAQDASLKLKNAIVINIREVFDMENNRVVT